ncbi:MAG TPA: DUF3467 domain-containing protein [Caldilineae bacterium]|nr:DUF3467 domain-containing protein [Caldilineae bacterium]
MTDPDKPRPRINVEIPADLPMTYANFAIINHTPSEVVIDFAQLLPNMPKAKVQARILLTPLNAKLLHQALGENLARYEERFGPIPGSEELGGRDVLGGLEWRLGPILPPDDHPPQT